MIQNNLARVQEYSRRLWVPFVILVSAIGVFPALVVALGFDRALQLVVRGGAGLGILVIVAIRPTWVVAALFLILGLFGQQLFISGIPFSLRGSEVLTGVLVARWLAVRALRRTKVVHSSLDAPIFAYCAVLALGVIYGIVGGWDARTALREGIKLGVLILYFPLKDLLAQDLKLFSRGIVLPLQIGVAISATLAIVSVLLGRGDPIVLDPYQPEAALMAFDIEGLSRLEALVPATSFAFVALIGLGQFLVLRKTTNRAMLLALICIAVVGIFLTFTRTRWVGLALGVLILVMVLSRRSGLADRVKLIGAIFTLGIIIWLVFMLIGAGPETILAERSKTWLERGLDYAGGIHRLNEVEAYWRIFLASPIFGQGLGAEVSFYSPGQGVITRTFAHNDYAMLLGKLGLIGASVLIGLGKATFQEMSLVLRTRNRDQYFAFAVGGLAFLISVLINGISIGGFSSFGSGPLIAAVFACIAVIGKSGKSVSEGRI